jgi:hypothetical protein
MLLRRLVVLAVLGFALNGGLSGRAEAGTLANIGTTRICTNCADRAGDLSRFGYVTLHAWEYGRIAAIKRASPNVKVLVYKDMAYSAEYMCRGGRDADLLPSGVGYCWALANHPDWFTLDGEGRRIEFDSYPGLWQMDVGARAYQDAWAANVLAELRQHGWDGVVIDDANPDESDQLGGKTMREYPTQPSYQAATRSFLANVGPRLMRAGFLVLPNIQANPVLADAKLWADWIQFTSGGHREYWMKWGSGPGGQYGERGWDDLEAVFETVQRAGKIFLATTTGPDGDVRSMRWARASFLVGWTGGPSALIFDPGASVDPWSPEWTIDIGRPRAPRLRVGAQAWRRDYTGGTAVLNASSTASATVQLGGSYLTPEGVPVTEVTLKPLTGLVLRLPPGAAPVIRPSAPRQTRPAKQRLAATVSLAKSPLSGRLQGHTAGSAHVTIYWRTSGDWRFFARVRADHHGRYQVRKEVRALRPIALRAVARIGGSVMRSRVLRID